MKLFETVIIVALQLENPELGGPHSDRATSPTLLGKAAAKAYAKHFVTHLVTGNPRSGCPSIGQLNHRVRHSHCCVASFSGARDV